MKKTVIVYEVYETYVDVEADSNQEALDIVEYYLAKGTNDKGQVIPDAIYSYCLDKSEWKVLNS